MFVQRAYTGLLVVANLLGFLFIRNAYDAGPVVAAYAVPLASWVPIHLLARVIERRWLKFSTQYKSFYIGDSLLLSAVAASFAVLSEDLPAGWYSEAWWPVVCMALGLLSGAMFHKRDRRAYSPSEMESPTKMWHDFVAFPLLVYYLLSQSPSLFYTRAANRFVPIVVSVVAIFIFGYLATVHDAEHPGTDAHRNFDWATMTSSKADLS